MSSFKVIEEGGRGSVARSQKTTTTTTKRKKENKPGLNSI